MEPIDLNRLRRYRALEFRQPVTQGKHSVKRSLYRALHKRLSLVLRRWRPARTISYRPFLKHQRFVYISLLYTYTSILCITYFFFCLVLYKVRDIGLVYYYLLVIIIHKFLNIFSQKFLLIYLLLPRKDFLLNYHSSRMRYGQIVKKTP